MAIDIPDGWSVSADGKALERSYRFKDFAEAFAFLTRVAAHAEAVNHHPEFTSVWNRVDFRLTSHDSDEITQRDVALAEAIDGLAGTR
jgi:4a-hydroxytetrahydrobiopterin dehydratase